MAYPEINVETRSYIFWWRFSHRWLYVLKQVRRRRKRERQVKMWLRVSAIIFQLVKLIMLEKMCSNYPGIKLEPALGTWEDKIEHLSSYADVVHTTAKQVISRRRKNENVYKMSKNEKCTCKACKNTVFHCQICKFVGFSFPLSSWLLKLPNFPKKTSGFVAF